MKLLVTVTAEEARRMRAEGAKGVLTLKRKLRHEVTRVLFAQRKRARSWTGAYVFGYQDVLSLQETVDKRTIIMLSAFKEPSFTIPVQELFRPLELLKSSEPADKESRRIKTAPKPWCYVE